MISLFTFNWDDFFPQAENTVISLWKHQRASTQWEGLMKSDSQEVKKKKKKKENMNYVSTDFYMKGQL